jgi:hypothetical protein
MYSSRVTRSDVSAQEASAAATPSRPTQTKRTRRPPHVVSA